jgi:hypothetical protein
VQAALNARAAEILARLPLTRFSDPAAVRSGCDLRRVRKVAVAVAGDLAALEAAGMLRAGEWPQPVPPRAVVRSLVIAEEAAAEMEAVP